MCVRWPVDLKVVLRFHLLSISCAIIFAQGLGAQVSSASRPETRAVRTELWCGGQSELENSQLLRKRLKGETCAVGVVFFELHGFGAPTKLSALFKLDSADGNSAQDAISKVIYDGEQVADGMRIGMMIVAFGLRDAKAPVVTISIEGSVNDVAIEISSRPDLDDLYRDPLTTKRVYVFKNPSIRTRDGADLVMRYSKEDVVAFRRLNSTDDNCRFDGIFAGCDEDGASVAAIAPDTAKTPDLVREALWLPISMAVSGGGVLRCPDDFVGVKIRFLFGAATEIRQLQSCPIVANHFRFGAIHSKRPTNHGLRQWMTTDGHGVATFNIPKAIAMRGGLREYLEREVVFKPALNWLGGRLWDRTNVELRLASDGASGVDYIVTFVSG